MAATGSKTDLEEAEKTLGFNFCPDGYMYDASLNVRHATVHMWDWMHCYLENGPGENEIRTFVNHVGKRTIEEYVQRWTWPRGYASAHNVFRKGKLATDASQVLSLAPVLDHYCRCRDIGDVGASVSALAHVLLLLQQVNSGSVGPEELHCAIQEHLRLQKVAWDVQLWQPKTHFVTHLPQQLHSHGLLVSTFVHERKHAVVKSLATLRENTTAYERGLAEDLVCHHFARLGRGALDVNALEKPRPASAKAVAALRSAVDFPTGVSVDISACAKIAGRAVVGGDVVAMRQDDGALAFAQVQFHACIDGVLISCVSHWPCVSFAGTFAKCRVLSSRSLVGGHALLEPCIYSEGAGHVATILLPSSLRTRAGQPR